jgi:hypothetical protein
MAISRKQPAHTSTIQMRINMRGTTSKNLADVISCYRDMMPHVSDAAKLRIARRIGIARAILCQRERSPK